MDRQVYENKRNELVLEAQNFINASNLEEYNRIEVEIKNLDTQFEDEAKAQANLDALNNTVNTVNIVSPKNIVPLSNVGAIDPLNLENGIIDVDIENKKNEELYVNAWAKHMMNKVLTDEERAIFDAKNEYTHTTDNTGIVIPETIMTGIWSEAASLYPLWADVFKTGIKGNVTLLEEESSTEAKWYKEEVETEDGTEKIKKGYVLTGCELSRDIMVSWRLREMSMKEFIPYIQTQLAKAMGAGLAYGVSQGKGASEENPEPKGIITTLMSEANKPHVIEYTPDTDDLSYTKMTSAMSKIKSTYMKGACVYADNSTIWNKLANLVDSVGRPYFIPDPTSGGVGRIFGLIVKEDDSIPTGSILIGNANAGYHANVNKQATLDSEEYKKKRKTCYISYAIVDGAVRTTNAFAFIAPKTVTQQLAKDIEASEGK